jgi:hypothetical protein
MSTSKHIAQSRSDLTDWLLHLSHGPEDWPLGYPGAPKEGLYRILFQRRVAASKQRQIVRFDAAGAACFYGVPHWAWPQLVDTNPSGRRGYGIMVMKSVFERLGGEPVIYDKSRDGAEFHPSRHYRLVVHDPVAGIDWSHEKEFRFRGDFDLNATPCWAPVVETNVDAAELYRTFSDLASVWSLEAFSTTSNGWINRPTTLAYSALH